MKFPPHFKHYNCKLHNWILACAWIGGLSAPVLYQASLLEAQTTTKIIINNNEEWKFSADTVPPADQWIEPNFDDRAWKAGNAPFHYGETALTAGTKLPEKTIWTAYFRKKFNLVDPKTVTRMILNIQFDDAVIVYLNGVEIARSNIQAGPVEYTTPATVDHEYLTSPINQNVPAAGLSTLVAGENLLAIELHQVSLESSDMVVIPKLSAVITAPPAAQFVRGNDCDGSPDLDLADAIYLLRWKLLSLSSYPEPGCIKSCDMNDDGSVDISDAVYGLMFLFAGGEAIKAPYPAEGVDPTEDILTCVSGAPAG